MKGKFDEDIDKKITDYLNYKAEEVSVPECMLFKIRNNIGNENISRNMNRTVRFFKVKTIIAIGILCIATTITSASETTNSHWFNQSEIASGIHQFPGADTVKETLGYLPKYAETFEGGFKVKSFNIIDNSSQDSADKKVTNVGDFEYTKDGANENQYLKITATRVDKQSFYYNIKFSESYGIYNNSIQIYWGYILCKEVPDDYVETEEDLNLIKDGIMDITFGADKINIYNIRYVFWYEDGTKYMIRNKGYDDVNIDEMIDMAKKVISQ